MFFGIKRALFCQPGELGLCSRCDRSCDLFHYTLLVALGLRFHIFRKVGWRAPALPTLHGTGGEMRWDDRGKVPGEGLLRSDVRGQMSGQPSGAPRRGPFHQPGRHWGLAPYGAGEPAEPRQGEGMCSGASRDEGGVH